MYTSNNDLYRTTAASWHDSLQVWMSPERPEVEDIPETCREEVVAWDFHATKVATDVMELLSEGLGFEGRRFKELTFSDMRLRALLSLLHGNEWLDVKPVPGGLIINVGDWLQIISNGEYQSVQHRVLATSWKEARISIVIFFNLAKWREDGCYGPLPELLSPEKPPVYRDFTAQEYLENFIAKG
ncbi:hypothetical protein PS1_014022 [Malus domestica]